MPSSLKSAAAAAVLAVAAVSANATSVTPTSPASPTAGDNGSLLLVVWDNDTGQSIVEDLSLTISGIQPASMNTAGTVLDFGSINLSTLNTTNTANQHYMVVAADFQQNGNGTPPQRTGAGNNLYVTGDFSAFTGDASNIEGAAKTVSTYLANVFNSGSQCNHANPCLTTIGTTQNGVDAFGDPVWVYDSRYFGTNKPGTFTPPPNNASLGLGGPFGGTTFGSVGSALSFWALNVIGNDTNASDGNTNTLNKTQYAGQFLLDSSGHLTYTVSSVPLPAAGWLLVSGLLGLGTIGRRRNAVTAA